MTIHPSIGCREDYATEIKKDNKGESIDKASCRSVRYTPYCIKVRREKSINLPPLLELEKHVKQRWKENQANKKIDYHVLHSVMIALDNIYKIKQVYKKYVIFRISVRDHYCGKTKNRKKIFIVVEKEKFIKYMKKMVT